MSGQNLLLLGAVQQVISDPYFEYNTLLLPGNGTNGAQNNTFLDSSTNAFSITRNGNTTQGTFSPFSQTGWGAYFDGTGDYLTAGSSISLSSSFTIEGWVYITSTAANTVLFGLGVNSTSTGLSIFVTTTGQPRMLANASYLVSGSAGQVTANQWVHIALVRNSTSLTLYVNGTSVGTGTSSATYSGTAYIGAENYASTIYPTAAGYSSNLRVVTSAVYTSNFTPSATPLTAITNTSLLTCQSNRFIDNSTNAFAITRNGDVSVQAFSPFNPTAAWSAATNGGSGYFDGSGDYLTAGATSNFNFLHNSSALFTIEGWIYVPALGSGPVIFGTNSGTSSQVGTLFWIETTGELRLLIGRGSGGSPVVDATSTATVSVNQWCHVAVTYDQSQASSNCKFYINGTAAGTTNKTANAPSASNSAYPGTINAFGTSAAGACYLSSIRVNNSVVYASAFTPPTAPLTAITNTSLLTNFTNAGIYDATSKNDLETVGNAQISTTQSKFGGSSMYFDGTDDRLVAPSNIDVAIGTADFTIEGWFYTASPATNRGLFQISTTAGGLEAGNTNNLAVYCSSSVLGVYYASTFKAGTTSISADTWTHFALVRTGGSTKLYVNGTADSGFGTNADTQNYTGKNVCVGGYFSTAYLWSGYIQDFRITRGYARYTSNFTAPTAAFPVL